MSIVLTTPPHVVITLLLISIRVEGALFLLRFCPLFRGGVKDAMALPSVQEPR